jgi:transposase
MFLPEPRVRIWLCTEPCDMRKSYDGLSAFVVSRLGEVPTSGQLFVFINRRKTQLKVLYFQPSGYCLWCHRLEQGQFNYLASSDGKRLLSWSQLRLLIDGLKIEKARQFKRYSYDSPT